MSLYAKGVSVFFRTDMPEDLDPQDTCRTCDGFAHWQVILMCRDDSGTPAVIVTGACSEPHALVGIEHGMAHCLDGEPVR